MKKLARLVFVLSTLIYPMSFIGCDGASDAEITEADQISRDNNYEMPEPAYVPQYRERPEPTPEAMFREAYAIYHANDDRSVWKINSYEFRTAARLYRESATRGLAVAIPEYHATLDAMLDRGMVDDIATEVGGLEGEMLERSWGYVQCAYDAVATKLQEEKFVFARDYLVLRQADYEQFTVCSLVPDLLEEQLPLAEMLNRETRAWKRHYAISQLHEECDGVFGGDLFRAFQLLDEIGDQRALKVAAVRLGEKGGEEAYQFLLDYNFPNEARMAALRPYYRFVEWFFQGRDVSPYMIDEVRTVASHQIENLEQALVWAGHAGLTKAEVRKELDAELRRLESDGAYALAAEVYRLLGDAPSADKMAVLAQR